jgi:hypothetical protein
MRSGFVSSGWEEPPHDQPVPEEHVTLLSSAQPDGGGGVVVVLLVTVHPVETRDIAGTASPASSDKIGIRIVMMKPS